MDVSPGRGILKWSSRLAIVYRRATRPLWPDYAMALPEGERDGATGCMSPPIPDANFGGDQRG